MIRLESVRSRVRLVEILRASEEIGIDSLPLDALHTIAYFTDALAPLWHFPLVEAQLLKQRSNSTSPELQSEVDELVGEAVVIASSIRHIQVDGRWRLDASYKLQSELGDRIIAAVLQDDQSAEEFFFVREVVLALAGLGLPGITRAASVDAAYSDPSVDYESVLDLAGEDAPNKTAQVATRFAELLDNESMSAAELTHLYVRHLYRQLGGAVA